MPQLSIILAKNIRRLRGEKTQREFARKLGISSGTVARLEVAGQNTTLATLDVIMKSLNCDICELLKEDKE